MDHDIKDKIKENLSYDKDTGLFTWLKSTYGRKEGNIAGGLDQQGYVVIGFNYVQYKAHRLAFLFMEGEIPDFVDHANGIRDDNRWCNLRPACIKTNGWNRKGKSTGGTGYKSVYLDTRSGKYKSQITVDGIQKHLGYFDCPEKAHEAYKKAADKHFGEFKNYG